MCARIKRCILEPRLCQFACLCVRERWCVCVYICDLIRYWCILGTTCVCVHSTSFALYCTSLIYMVTIIYKYVLINIYTYIYTYIYMHIYTYMHTHSTKWYLYIYNCIYIYMYLHTRRMTKKKNPLKTHRFAT